MIHIDGDLLVYRCGFAAEKAHYYLTLPEDNGDETVKHFPSKKEMDSFLEQNVQAGVLLPGVDFAVADGKAVYEVRRELEPLKNALYNVKSIINSICDSAEKHVPTAAGWPKVYLSGPTNFRNDVATIRPYKGNRDPEHKPTYAPQIKRYMQRHWDYKISNGQEADDDVATAHYAMYVNDPNSTVIATTDKDLDMVPGWHYNFVKDKAYFVEPKDARLAFYKQLIVGDPTDNIVGVPGYGDKKAAAVIAKYLGHAEDIYLCLEDAILQLYIEHFGPDAEEVMKENGKLLWIRQEPEQEVPWALSIT